jgi:hypothetical protein
MKNDPNNVTALPEIPASEAIRDDVPAEADHDIEILRSIPKQFSIADEASVNWVVRKIVQARQYCQQAREFAAREEHRAIREEKTLLFLFGRQIEKWAKNEIERRGGRRRSLEVPAGILAFRKLNSSIHIEDELAVLAWAKRHCPSAVVVSEKLSRSALVDHFKATGDIPEDGVSLLPERDSFSIK